jgi:phenylpropionate dioxygenase-like ring-hydroxylating dioxygenase large terminal subunit
VAVFEYRICSVLQRVLDNWLSIDNIDHMLSTDNRTEFGDILDAIRDYLDADPPTLSLPPSAYTSQALWQLERERIFNRSWILVAHVDQLAETGDYVALSISGEPIVVTRAHDGRLHALSSICQHRLMPLVEPGTGRTDALTCRYHRRYGLDGRLRGAPYMAGSKDFNPRACRLPQFAVATWNGLVWVNLDKNAEPVANHLDLAAEEFANYRLAEATDTEARAQTKMFTMEMINDEDRTGVEAVQRATGSRFSERGHLSPKEQPSMLAFYRNLADALVGTHADGG